MAVITKIRRQSGILIGVIGVCLISFLLMDAINSDTSRLRGNSNNVGEINGQEISYTEFDAKYKEEEQNYMIQNPDLTEQDRQGIRERIWRELMYTYMMQEQFDQLGVRVSKAELEDLFLGKNPHPWVAQQFTNRQTGRFDPADVRFYLSSIGQRENADELRRELANFETQVRSDQMRNKYFNLIKKSIYIPTWMAKQDHIERNSRASISYVQIPFASIPDNEVKISDDDLEDYLEKHAYQYRQDEETRSIDYVSFELVPSKEDTMKAFTWITKNLEKFKAAENDSIYVKRAGGLYADNYYSKEQLNAFSPTLSDTLFKIAPNTIIGPVFEGGEYRIAKLISKAQVPDSVQARHILIQVGEGVDTAKAKDTIDSLKREVEKGADFAELAKVFSKDPGSAVKGGDLGWAKHGQSNFVKPFNDAIFYNNRQGQLVVVETQFGFHLIQIQQTKNIQPAVKLAMVSKKVETSDKTEDEIYNKATVFAENSTTPEAFEKNVKSYNLVKKPADNIKRSDVVVGELENPKEVIRWAFDAEKGKISSAIPLENTIVVAHLRQVREEGVAEVEDIKEELEAKVRMEKKGQMIREKIEKANAKDINAVASVAGQQVKTAENVIFAYPFIAGIGNEPKVVGRVFGLKPNEISEPITGNTGVFIVKVNNISPAPETTDYSLYTNHYYGAFASRADYEVFEAIKKRVGVVDQRYKFY